MAVLVNLRVSRCARVTKALFSKGRIRDQFEVSHTVTLADSGFGSPMLREGARLQELHTLRDGALPLQGEMCSNAARGQRHFSPRAGMTQRVLPVSAFPPLAATGFHLPDAAALL